MTKRRCFIAGLAVAVACIAASVFGAHPVAFNRHHVPPGWAVCNKCNGAGCVVRNWLGITKKCEKCNGLGIRRIVRNMPVPPPVVHHHKPHPHVKAPPKPRVNAPAKPRNQPKGAKAPPPKGKPPAGGKGRR